MDINVIMYFWRKPLGAAQTVTTKLCYDNDNYVFLTQVAAVNCASQKTTWLAKPAHKHCPQRQWMSLQWMSRFLSGVEVE